MKLLRSLVALLLLAPAAVVAQDAPKPLRAMLIIGGCCHDYAKQKDLLKAGLEERANLVVDVLYTPDKSTKARFEELTKPNWAQGYDVVIHDECSADVKEPEYVENILAEHRRGVPGVNLHCAMHCYRTGTPVWFEYIGLQSTGHGPQLPIQVSYSKNEHPITKGLTDWTTGREELYNNLKVWDGVIELARGKQGDGDQPGKNDSLLAWAHHYGEKKTPVFSTTLAHNNDTVSDARFLDLVVRGLLWSCGKLNDDGTPKAGYGPKAK